MPTPTSTPIASAGTSGVPPVTSLATTTPVSVITNANDRSNTRAVSGIRIANAARPVIAFVLRICFAVPAFGNVSGTQIANRTTIASQT
jgi:riboflavin transporter FmnP